MAKQEYIYGTAHSVLYTPSVVSPMLVERDQDDNIVKINSDVHLLVRQKNLHKTIGVESLRAYVDALERTPIERPNLTDDELFQLIEPKDINTLTDAYQYAQYLKSHENDVKERYENLKKYKESLKTE